MIYLLLTWLAAPLLWLRIALRGERPLRRILVVQTAKIGDFVATTPVFRALRTGLPETEIVALLHPVNVPLAEGLDSIDRIVTLPSHGYRGWQGKWWLFTQFRAGFDGVLLLSPNLPGLLAGLWAGIPRRVSVLPDRRQGIARLAWPFLTHGEPHVPGRLFRGTALLALRGLGLAPARQAGPSTGEAFCRPAAISRRQQLFSNHPGCLVGIGIGAGNRMKALGWPELLALCASVLQDSRTTLVLVGTVADSEVAVKIAEHFPMGKVIDTTGRWELADLPALLAGLHAFIGVDSGATYLADAVGIPVLDFMGPADADDQRPVGPGALVLKGQTECSPCSHAFDAPYRCRYGHRNCLKYEFGDFVPKFLETVDAHIDRLPS